jgi:hypothetical protein
MAEQELAVIQKTYDFIKWSFVIGRSLIHHREHRDHRERPRRDSSWHFSVFSVYSVVNPLGFALSFLLMNAARCSKVMQVP